MDSSMSLCGERQKKEEEMAECLHSWHGTREGSQEHGWSWARLNRSSGWVWAEHVLAPLPSVTAPSPAGHRPRRKNLPQITRRGKIIREPVCSILGEVWGGIWEELCCRHKEKMMVGHFSATETPADKFMGTWPCCISCEILSQSMWRINSDYGGYHLLDICYFPGTIPDTYINESFNCIFQPAYELDMKMIAL